MSTYTQWRARIAAFAGALVVTMIPVAAAQGSGSAPADVPAAVVKSFQQTYPSATITSALRQHEGDRVVFRVEGLLKGRKQAAVYDATGAVLEVAQQVDERDLPPPVATAMHSHPRAIFVTGLKLTRGRSVQYQLTLRGTRKTAMVVQPDGTVLSFK